MKQAHALRTAVADDEHDVRDYLVGYSAHFAAR